MGEDEFKKVFTDFKPQNFGFSGSVAEGTPGDLFFLYVNQGPEANRSAEKASTR